MQTASRLYEVHAGILPPFADRPQRSVGMERGGDEW